MTKLILVRHGETAVNESGVMHKYGDAERLNDRGKDQLQKTANVLKELNSTIVYSSKENRAVESASIIAKVCELEHREVDGLEERNWGVYSGKPWSDVKKILDKLTLEERYNYIPDGGESWKTFEERLITAVKSILSDNNGGVVVLVSHGGSIRALMPYLLSVGREESFKYDPDNASISEFDYDGKKFSKVRINDTTHLFLLRRIE